MTEPHATTAGTEAADEWTFVYRPRLMPRVAVVAAFVVVVVHIVFAALLTISNTGPDVTLSDQVGLALIGVVEGVAICVFTRARVRVGPAGIGVRNVASERVFAWDEVLGLSYPDGKMCARLLFADDEHIPVLAIQARDGDRAVAAMQRIRAEQAEHGGMPQPE